MTDTLSPEIIACIRRALDEDIGGGDATTDSIVPVDATSSGRIIAKEAAWSPGWMWPWSPIAWWMRASVSPSAAEGATVAHREPLAQLVAGPACALLTAERTASNFVGRMSGIATLTRRFVDAVAGTCAVILDTREDCTGSAHAGQAGRAPWRRTKPPHRPLRHGT